MIWTPAFAGVTIYVMPADAGIQAGIVAGPQLSLG